MASVNAWHPLQAWLSRKDAQLLLLEMEEELQEAHQEERKAAKKKHGEPHSLS